MTIFPKRDAVADAGALIGASVAAAFAFAGILAIAPFSAHPARAIEVALCAGVLAVSLCGFAMALMRHERALFLPYGAGPHDPPGDAIAGMVAQAFAALNVVAAPAVAVLLMTAASR